MSDQKNIDSHPLELTQEEYDRMPSGKGVGDDWKYMPMGSRFKQSTDPSIIVEVCEGMDMFVDQWGAGLSVPKRGLRRYRAVIVIKEEA